MSELWLHNSLTLNKDKFVPNNAANVTMYVCGPTVYSAPHIGNARPAVVFDLLFRVLRQTYGSAMVQYARNLTDVDDKIISEANLRGVTIDTLTRETTEAYHADMYELGVLSPTFEPRATEHISEIISFVKTLIDKNAAYEKNGEVFFDVQKHTGESLARHTNLNAGERVEVNPNKRSPHDFVLWKPAKQGEPYWESPWGNGRPGWHIECSSMIHKALGESIDIHGGGLDLRFPHHECEIMQSQAYNGKLLANYWVHNGLLTVDGQKMSKSVGNVIYLNSLLDRYPGESIRYLFLSTHYRSPLNFTMTAMESAHQSLKNFYDFWNDIDYIDGDAQPFDNVLEALHDDLNTSLSLSHMFKWLEVLQRKPNPDKLQQFVSSMKLMGFFRDKDHWNTRKIDSSMIEEIVNQRRRARENKDWAESDRLREQLLSYGVTVADGPKGTAWRWN